MKIVFMGTPEFAASILKAVKEAGHEVTAVYTQPDKPKGRSGALIAPPVKEYAEAQGIPVYQPVKIKAPESVEVLKTIPADVYVVAAYGQILSQEILDIPKFGCINVHGSLLPKFRGASPIQSAIISGERITGCTTMLTDIGMDTGDILLKKEVEIGENETYGELYARLSVLGAELLKQTISELEAGTLVAVAQNSAEATHCRTIKKSEAQIDFSAPSQAIHDLVRGLDPSPIAFALCGSESIKVFKTCPIGSGHALYAEAIEAGVNAAVGECVIANPKKGLAVKTGDGFIEIRELQFPNSKRMEAKAALNGKKLLGVVFDTPQKA